MAVPRAHAYACAAPHTPTPAPMPGPRPCLRLRPGAKRRVGVCPGCCSVCKRSEWLCVEAVRSTASTAAAAEPKAVEKILRSEVGF